MMESLHDQIRLNRLLQNQKLGRKIPVSLLLFTYDHHYYNVNTILEVFPLKEVATTLDDIISRVFKLVEDALGDDITS